LELGEQGPASSPGDLEPLPSFELPTDRRLTTARALAAAIAPSVNDVVHATAQKTTRRVIAITPDTESARALAGDVSFLLGALDADDAEASGASSFGQVLLYLPNEASPYADVNPDRRGAQTRLSTLFHLGMELPWSVLVCPIAALSRKVVPRETVLEHAELVVAGQEIDRDKLAARLAAAGYVRSPLVEDPGSLAIRGALMDVWAPSAEVPVRIEFYGDLLMSIKS